MKQLQNNFTTPEQSKRLLELGMPVKSCNCYHPIQNYRIQDSVEVIKDSETFFENNVYLKDFFPCWSVGRMMEIYLICQTFGEGLHFSTADDWDEEMLEDLCDLFSTMVKCNYIDFSKLEDKQ